MDCSNPQCGQAIEPGNKFCTKCGAPGRKEEPPPKLQMPSTPLEKHQNIKHRPNIFFVIISSIIVAAGIAFYIESNNRKVEGVTGGVPNTSTSEPSKPAPIKSGDMPNKEVVESLQEEATQVCSEYARVFKECYMKASNGVPPAQAKDDIKSQRLDTEMIDTSCRDGFTEHGRLGGVSSPEINKMTSLIFSNCFSGFIEGGSNRISKEHIKGAYVAAWAYFSEEPKGVLTAKKLEVYNYKPSAEVTISIINCTSDNLSISARHKDGDVTYVINSAGDITEKK
jgi:hypothetical protein